MFAQKRRDSIVDLVNHHGQARVKALSDEFEVTEDCIRKDLAILEQQGLVSRLYGGAIKTRTNPHELNVAQRQDKNIEVKQRIAAKALSLISEGDTVFLDISTSNAELARLIAASNLKITVVTNMVAVLLQFCVPCPATLVFIGGSLSPGMDGFIGAETIAGIRRFRFDTAFMGVVGVDLYRNRVETYLLDDGLTKEAAMNSSKKKYLLMEPQKFSNEAPFKFAELEEFTGIVTGDPVPEAMMDALKKYGVEVV
jgi:DeoR family glycerol-3-phosphate regulon repressor